MNGPAAQTKTLTFWLAVQPCSGHRFNTHDAVGNGGGQEFGQRVYQCPPIHHRIQGEPGDTWVSVIPRTLDQVLLLSAGFLLF